MWAASLATPHDTGATQPVAAVTAAITAAGTRTLFRFRSGRRNKTKLELN